MTGAIDFPSLLQQCAPRVAPITMMAIVRAESSFNPYAIGVVGGCLPHQPTSRKEATAVSHALDVGGWNYSVGLAQVNRANWVRYGLDAGSAFDPCQNLAVGSAILEDCYARALKLYGNVQDALRASLSCYSTGNFTNGYKTGYVRQVIGDALINRETVVPAIDPTIRDSSDSSKTVNDGAKQIAHPHVPLNAGGSDVGVTPLPPPLPEHDPSNLKGVSKNSAVVF